MGECRVDGAIGGTFRREPKANTRFHFRTSGDETQLQRGLVPAPIDFRGLHMNTLSPRKVHCFVEQTAKFQGNRIDMIASIGLDWAPSFRRDREQFRRFMKPSDEWEVLFDCARFGVGGTVMGKKKVYTFLKIARSRSL